MIEIGTLDGYIRTSDLSRLREKTIKYWLYPEKTKQRNQELDRILRRLEVMNYFLDQMSERLKKNIENHEKRIHTARTLC